MNVINKFKSKIKKQSSTQSYPLPSQPQSKEDAISNTTSQVSLEPVLTLEEPFVFSNVSEKNENFQDVDSVNIDEYYERKDRKMKMINKLQSSQAFPEELKQSHFSLQVKKSYNVGDISVFEGDLIHKTQGCSNSKGRVKLSCSQDVIQFPQTIHKIILSKIIFLTPEEGLFVGDDVMKIAEKKYKK